MTHRRDAARRTYLRLGLGELAATAVFAAIGIFVVAPKIPAALPAWWFALIPLLVILGQAGAYWLLARRWATVAAMPAGVASLYRALRTIDAILLATGLIGIVVWWPAPWGAAMLVIAVWGFGGVEYLNYFWARLAYPLDRWFTQVSARRTPRLIKDLRKARPRTSATA